MKGLFHHLVIALVVLLNPAFLVPCNGGNMRTQQDGESAITSHCFSIPTVQRSLFTASVQQPANCEDVLLYLDEAVGMTRKLRDSYLIVIGRQGKGEKAIQVNRRRLEAVEQYLKRFSDLNYLTAQGGSVDGPGRVELYVGGKLLRMFIVKRGLPGS